MTTLAEILDGPMKERSNDDARRGIPMTEAEVRWFINTMEKKTKQKAARKGMAKHGAEFGERSGLITPEGVALYHAYHATFS